MRNRTTNRSRRIRAGNVALPSDYGLRCLAPETRFNRFNRAVVVNHADKLPDGLRKLVLNTASTEKQDLYSRQEKEDLCITTSKN